jgi:hypothetical protein
MQHQHHSCQHVQHSVAALSQQYVVKCEAADPPTSAPACPQVEKAPVVVKTSVSKGDAEAMKKQLEAGGCWLIRGWSQGLGAQRQGG